MAKAALQDQQDEEESQGLLARRASRSFSCAEEAINEAGAAGGGPPANTSSPQARASSSAGSSSKEQLKSGGSATDGKETGICRICLEEDCTSVLETPCACSGTQRHAHHACIQRWIDEKGNARCEICEQPYRGGFTVPPPPATLPVDTLPLFTPMYILEASDPRHPYPVQRLDALLDADQGLYQRNHSVSWCITFIIFFMFMVVLHHTLVVADGMDDPNAPGDAGAPPGVPTGAGSDPSGSAAGGLGDNGSSVVTDLLLFLFWLATKAFLIGMPLLAIMRIASRQAQREHYEAMLQAASQYESAATNRRMVIRVRANPHSSSGTSEAGGRAAAPPIATAV